MSMDIKEAAARLAEEVSPTTEVRVVGVGTDADGLMVMVTGLPLDMDGHPVHVRLVSPPRLLTD